VDSAPDRQRLIDLLSAAHASVEESQAHWGAVTHLTGDTRYQRQQREVLALLDAMRRRVEAYDPEN
jgi:hypothetical protein